MMKSKIGSVLFKLTKKLPKTISKNLKCKLYTLSKPLMLGVASNNIKFNVN